MTSLGAADKPIGLRERKKLRTRATIREEAMRLFAEQGYGQTTVEQIAEAAEISPSTFFRYFPTKEDLVLTDDLDDVMISAFREQPAGVDPIAAFRTAVRATFAQLTPREWEREQRRRELVDSVPELRLARFDEYLRAINLLAGLIAERLGRTPEDFRIRVFAGAVIGTTLAAYGESGPREPDENGAYVQLDRIDEALDLLAQGLPLD